jgi:hypothetical protein
VRLQNGCDSTSLQEALGTKTCKPLDSAVFSRH